MKIIWTGWQLKRMNGYGVVWRELGCRLADYGIGIIDFWCEDWDLAVFLGYPKAFLLGKEAKRPDLVFHTMWETDTLPDFWVPLLNRAGLVWTPSKFCAGVMRKAGVETEIAVTRYGVDCERFEYRKRDDDSQFVFLAMGRIFGGRKGIGIVLRAFLQLRESGKLGDDARLVIKASKLPWDTVSHKGIYRDDVTLVTEKISNADMVALYQDCDVFVYPTAGEGFALEPLEAMATGACALVTNWSGPTEYIADGVCIPLEISGLAPFRLEQFEDRGNMAVVSVAEVREKMLWCYENRDAARQIGVQAAQYVREQWTWDMAAKQAAEMLKEYYRRIEI